MFALIAAQAAANHGAISAGQLAAHGLPVATRTRWVALGVLTHLGARSYAVGGSPSTWERDLAATIIDLDGRGFLAGRTAARLHGLEGFASSAIEVLVPRAHRRIQLDARVAYTSLPLDNGATVIVNGFRCLTAERLILDGPLFDFTRAEAENAIDSGIRLRLVSEQRLRTRVIARHNRGINGGRVLLEALVDTGGESRLERWMLRIVREAGLPRPVLQRTYREGTRVIARVDMLFGDLVVEIAGHGFHSSRRQLQRDEQRRTELTTLGLRTVAFRYEDVRDRPAWVVAQLRALVRTRPGAAA
ncbi:MAG: hypothetical protein JWM12_3179 [Ilumatobacteraceae bacterium]|nr:hypothetical protein [Ilumatobacteraceae bacterium]